MTDRDRIERALSDARELELTDLEVMSVVARARDAGPRRVSRFGRRRIVVGVLIPVVCAAGAAAYVARPSDEKIALAGINCVLTAERGANSGPGTAVPDGRDPVTICAELWASAMVDRRTKTVPPLVACVSQTAGDVTVYPTADKSICERLDQTTVPAGYEKATAQLAPLQRRVERLWGGGGWTAQELRAGETGWCRSLPIVTEIAEAEIRRLRLVGWQVRTTGSGSCAVSGRVDGDMHSVIIELHEPFEPHVDDRPPDVVKHENAWVTAWQEVRSEFPGFATTGLLCGPPAETIARLKVILKRADVTAPLELALIGRDHTIGFTSRLHCMGLVDEHSDENERIVVWPDAPLGELYPTDAELEALGPGETFGLPTFPGLGLTP